MLPPRHAARATRATGRRTRSLLLDAAARLFADRGLGGVSLAEIAAEADAFPSQVTYYFGSKEALFVEAACREMLHAGARVEAAGGRARSREDYSRALAREALRSPAPALFAEALLLARRAPDLAPLISRTLDRLHTEGARAVAARCAGAGWPLSAPPESIARGFWATVLGLALEGAADARTGRTAEASVIAALSIHQAASAPDRPSRRVTTPAGRT